MQKIVLKSEQDTKNFANNFAKTLHGGQTISLIGDLGVGKTFFTKALGEALGIKDVIKSPSFNLMKVYNLNQKPSSLKKELKNINNINTVVHVDCYRLNSSAELVDIGLLDFINQKNVLVIIEWADKVKKILPKNTCWLEFKIKKNELREIKIKEPQSV